VGSVEVEIEIVSPWHLDRKQRHRPLPPSEMTAAIDSCRSSAEGERENIDLGEGVARLHK
jgi:hypothetical protein